LESAWQTRDTDVSTLVTPGVGQEGWVFDASGVFSMKAGGKTMSEQKKTLNERLGRYDAIAAVANDLVARLNKDPQLGCFWAHRGEDGIRREKQLLIDFLCERAGGPIYYRAGKCRWPIVE
jgi:hypothetical protein